MIMISYLLRSASLGKREKWKNKSYSDIALPTHECYYEFIGLVFQNVYNMQLLFILVIT